MTGGAPGPNQGDCPSIAEGVSELKKNKKGLVRRLEKSKREMGEKGEGISLLGCLGDISLTRRNIEITNKKRKC